MKAFIVSLLPVLAPIFFSLLTAGTAWVALHLGALLKAAAQKNRFAAAVVPMDDLIFSVVQDIEANEKQAVLSTLAATGTLSAVDGAALKRIALDRIKQAMGPEGLDALKKAFGALLSGGLDTWLSGKVEVAVARVSAAAAALTAAKAVPK